MVTTVKVVLVTVTGAFPALPLAVDDVARVAALLDDVIVTEVGWVEAGVTEVTCPSPEVFVGGRVPPGWCVRVGAGAAGLWVT